MKWMSMYKHYYCLLDYPRVCTGDSWRGSSLDSTNLAIRVCHSVFFKRETFKVSPDHRCLSYSSGCWDKILEQKKYGECFSLWDNSVAARGQFLGCWLWLRYSAELCGHQTLSTFVSSTELTQPHHLLSVTDDVGQGQPHWILWMVPSSCYLFGFRSFLTFSFVFHSFNCLRPNTV